MHPENPSFAGFCRFTGGIVDADESKIRSAPVSLGTSLALDSCYVPRWRLDSIMISTSPTFESRATLRKQHPSSTSVYTSRSLRSNRPAITLSKANNREMRKRRRRIQIKYVASSCVCIANVCATVSLWVIFTLSFQLTSSSLDIPSYSLVWKKPCSESINGLWTIVRR